MSKMEQNANWKSYFIYLAKHNLLIKLLNVNFINSVRLFKTINILSIVAKTVSVLSI